MTLFQYDNVTIICHIISITVPEHISYDYKGINYFSYLVMVGNTVIRTALFIMDLTEMKCNLVDLNSFQCFM